MFSSTARCVAFLLLVTLCQLISGRRVDMISIQKTYLDFGGKPVDIALFEYNDDSLGGLEHNDDIFGLLRSLTVKREEDPYQDSMRMLYTYEQQVDIFRRAFNKDDEQIAEILAEPDACTTIQTFLEFIFDNAFDLLSHGAGTRKEQMRGFQQVVHMRFILKAVLIKQERPLNEDVSADICIDKVFVAAYGLVKGMLIAEAKMEGTWRDSVPESTEEQRISLKSKRDLVTTTTLNIDLNPYLVKPLPGVDYPDHEEPQPSME